MLKWRDKSFKSDLDKFLAEFNSQNPQWSDAQLKESAKHQRVADLRDKPQASESTSSLDI